MRTFRIVVLVVIGAISALGQAQAQRPNIDAFLQEWDADHDGTLDKKELGSSAGRTLLGLFAVRQGPVM